MNQMIEDAVKLVKDSDWKSFCISTIISKKKLAQEESPWDSDFTSPESIKNSVNFEIVSELRKKLDIPYDAVNGDGRIVFDFSSSRVFLKYEPIFVFGRYKKFSRELSQTRWICRKCSGKGCKSCEGKGKNYVSVEELIGEVFKKQTKCSEYFMHSSGREDVDALNTAGRPFILELKEPKQRNIDFEKLIFDERISISDFKITKRSSIELVSSSHFDKEYEAEIEFENDISDSDVEKLESIEGKILQQKTPNRVIHRRADIIRKRKIKKLKIKEKDKRKITILLTAEPGTYIKEFISGDEGRTVPNISSELNNPAKCTKLSVTRIDDDFLKILGL